MVKRVYGSQQLSRTRAFRTGPTLVLPANPPQAIGGAVEDCPAAGQVLHSVAMQRAQHGANALQLLSHPSPRGVTLHSKQPA